MQYSLNFFNKKVVRVRGVINIVFVPLQQPWAK